jgi:hypothetical protein
LALAVFCLAQGADSPAQDKQGKQKLPSSAERIMAALDQPTEFDFVEVPLKDVVEAIKARHGIEVQLDPKAITDLGTSIDMPVSAMIKGIPLRSALRLMLRDHQLDFVVSDDVLLITAAESPHVLRQYEVADLITDDAPLGALVEAVRFALPRKGAERGAPEPTAGAASPAPTAALGSGAALVPAPDSTGIDGEVTTFGTVMLVRTSERGQMDVSTLLAEMRHRQNPATSAEVNPAPVPHTENAKPQPKQPAAHATKESAADTEAVSDDPFAKTKERPTAKAAGR